MFRYLFFFIASFTIVRAYAQVHVRGTVKDNRGRPVALASITIQGTYDGATADSLGKFSFETLETGDQILQVSAIGFAEQLIAIKIEGKDIYQDILLKEDPNLLATVTITAGTFEASDTKRSTVLSSLDIVTTASANGDVVGAIKTLPGAQQVGESGGLFVRGGTAAETKVFIDGTLVNNFFFSNVPDIAQRGRFSPFLFKGTVFSSGAYSALYGQALSSALILESIDLPEQSSATAGISTVGLNAGFQQLAKDKKSSWGIGYNYTNLSAYLAVVKQRPDNLRTPELHNGDMNFRIKTSATGMLKFYGYFNSGDLGVGQADVDSIPFKNAFSIKNRNFYGNLSWKERLGPYWSITIGSSYSYNKDEIKNELVDQQNQKQILNHEPFRSKNFSLDAGGRMATVKAVLDRKMFGRGALRFGGEFQHFADKNLFSGASLQNIETPYNDQLTAAFAEVDFYVSTRLAAKVGTRFEHTSILAESNIAPRVSMAYKTSKRGQISLAFGEFFQTPEKDFFLQGYKFSNPGYIKATHYIANYQVMTQTQTLRTELFYKKYDELLKTHPVVGYTADSLSQAGYGEASGIEIFWRDRKTFKNFDYWLSYSYLDTRRDYLKFPRALNPSYAARHTASLVIKKFFTPLKMQLNGSYNFASGRPYYDIRGDATGNFKIFEQGKTIPYHNMSISINYLPNIGKENAKVFAVWVLSVSNVLGSNQVFGYNFSYKGDRKLPILPTARRFIFLGCFLSFGVDRSDEVINSNL